ncbi:uncharacterized protein PHACADRAFT_192409 [Phanerochaete carnosa HHB-10118-sp]|uniref:Uncharacterized protein n=1 Tax=Phanerochaete carnosa (strain HHB-10118-sp) TaxID=650164 RepID=K5VAW3_PHACS|nr:uncharacterized protein PHACADRAFT_192409 [Phanerochaete carnosa HHB-10118-sp]EKM60011.1 hypothetical protein PHACADRAFT_192409 [Phanerochaete carnosa HHB-10118-sp]
MFPDSPTSTYSLILLCMALYLLNWLKEHKDQQHRCSLTGVHSGSSPIAKGCSQRGMNFTALLLTEIWQVGGSPFRIATRRYWHYIVSGPKLIDELRHAPDDELSFIEAVAESFKLEYAIYVA